MIDEELKQLCQAYEDALLSNDVPSLEAFFWDSPDVVRLGPTENLFGSEQIKAFRRNRPNVNLMREVTKVDYIVLSEDTGVIHVCFQKKFKGVPRDGRQTQVWKRFPDLGWKIVSAHVSFMEVNA